MNFWYTEIQSGWAYKEKSGRLLRRQNEFKMNFLEVYSSQRVKGILSTKTTFNKVKYIQNFKVAITISEERTKPKTY